MNHERFYALFVFLTCLIGIGLAQLAASSPANDRTFIPALAVDPFTPTPTNTPTPSPSPTATPWPTLTPAPTSTPPPNYQLRDRKFGLASREWEASDRAYFGDKCFNWSPLSLDEDCVEHIPMIYAPQYMNGARAHIPENYSGKIYWLNEPARPDQSYLSPCDSVDWKLELESIWPNARFIGPNNIVDSLSWLEDYYDCHFEKLGFYPDSSEVAMHYYAWSEDYSRDRNRFEAMVAFYQSHNGGEPPKIHLTEYGITYWVNPVFRTVIARQFREEIRDDPRIIRATAYTRQVSSSTSWRFLGVFDSDGEITAYGCGLLLTEVTHPDCP